MTTVEIEALPKLCDGAARRLVDSFNSLVFDLCLANHSRRAWWFSWLSSRDRHNSGLFTILERANRFSQVLERSNDAVVQLGCPDPHAATLIARRASAQGWAVRRRLHDKTIWIVRRAAGRLRPLVDALKVLKRGIQLVSAARRAPHARDRLSGHDVILVTIFDQGTASVANDNFRDPYFGELPERLVNSGESVLLLGHVMGDIGLITRAAAAADNPVACTVGHAISYLDVCKSVASALFGKIDVGSASERPFGDMDDLIMADHRTNVIYVAYGHMIEAATARLLARNPGARVLHIYENNPWERACDLAAKAASPAREVRGYLHCAVLPSHLKNYISDGEKDLRPAPDFIVCTGPEARKIFRSLGEHDSKMVLSGCALRDSAVRDGVPRQKPPGRISNILVVLEGLEKMVGLLRFAEQAARIMPDVRFQVREHPALGLDRLADLAKVAMGRPGNFMRAPSEPLSDALAAADLVLYQGTTVAMNAAYLGIPLVRYVGDEILSDDPLFLCDALKRTVKAPADLVDAIRDFASMDNESFAREHVDARGFVDSYLAPATPDGLAAFGIRKSG